MSTLQIRYECHRLLNLRPVFLEFHATKNGPDAEVVEIGIIDSDSTVLMDELVRPKGEIDPAMTAVHGITNEIAKYATPWVDIWAKAEKLLSKRVVGVFHLEMRLDWMRKSHALNFLRWDPDLSNFFSIQKLHAEYKNDWNREANNFRTFDLEEAAEMVGLPSEPQTLHRRALEDARLARAILLAMAGWKVN